MFLEAVSKIKNMARKSFSDTLPSIEPAGVTRPKDVAYTYEVFTAESKPRYRTRKKSSVKTADMLFNSLQNGLEKWKMMNEKMNEAINEGENNGADAAETAELFRSIEPENENCRLELLRARLGRPALIKWNPKKHIYIKDVKLKKDFDSDS